MCISFFKKDKPYIVYPEKKKNPLATVSNLDIDVLKLLLIAQRKVSNPEFVLNNTTWILRDIEPSVAFTVANTIVLNPRWANVGVMAHEICHVEYGLQVSVDQGFADELAKTLTALRDNPWIKFLAKKQPYFNHNVVEAHAEVYRYLGEKMPAELRPFYPNLLEVD